MSEVQQWTALLGFDAFNPFPSDSSLDGLSFLGPSAPDAFPLTPINFAMPVGSEEAHQGGQPVVDVNMQPISVRNGQTESLSDSVQPWPPPLPSQMPTPSPVNISDAVISKLRTLLGKEDRQAPTPAALRLFLGTYFEVPNVHLPLLHAPSFDPELQPPGLLLAMAAVGALYRMERRAVALLYRAAESVAPLGASPIQIGFFLRGARGASVDPNAPEKWRSLAYYQTRLLLQYVGILGGNSELAERSLGMIAELSLNVRLASRVVMVDTWAVTDWLTY